MILNHLYLEVVFLFYQGVKILVLLKRTPYFHLIVISNCQVFLLERVLNLRIKIFYGQLIFLGNSVTSICSVSS